MIRKPLFQALTALTLFAALFASSPARAVDGFSLEAGCCADSTSIGRVGIFWDWDSRWFEAGDWYLGGYWDLSLGYWDGNEGPGGNITEIGLTPTFRLQQKGGGTVGYVEGAIGFHLMDGTRINNKNMSTNFQFGDHIGAGVMFGDKQQYDLSLRFQHLSNAGIENPNPGINFLMMRFAYRY